METIRSYFVCDGEVTRSVEEDEFNRECMKDGNTFTVETTVLERMFVEKFILTIH
jgi:hypothetical protein